MSSSTLTAKRTNTSSLGSPQFRQGQARLRYQFLQLCFRQEYTNWIGVSIEFEHRVAGSTAATALQKAKVRDFAWNRQLIHPYHLPTRLPERPSHAGVTPLILNTIGLTFGMLGVLVVFVWGPPLPDFSDSVGLDLGHPETVLQDGTRMGDILEANQRRKRSRVLGFRPHPCWCGTAATH
jgi:hypothetical protein